MLAQNNGAAVGIAGFRRIEETVEAGYSVYPALQRIGLATEGLHALVEWLFDQADISRLRATIQPDNTPIGPGRGEAGYGTDRYWGRSRYRLGAGLRADKERVDRRLALSRGDQRQPTLKVAHPSPS
jgi:hypothetical protein